MKGVRLIKMQNIKTGKEYVIKEGNKTGEIVLIERELQFYKFKINNQIIRVAR